MRLSLTQPALFLTLAELVHVSVSVSNLAGLVTETSEAVWKITNKFLPVLGDVELWESFLKQIHSAAYSFISYSLAAFFFPTVTS